MENLIKKIGSIFEKENKNLVEFHMFEGTEEELNYLEDLEEQSLLSEAIPLSVYRKWYKKLKTLKGHGGTDYRSRFNSWFPDKKDGLSTKWRVYIPYGGTLESKRKAKPPKDIQKALEDNGWTIEDYSTGMAIKKAGEKKGVEAEAWDKEKKYNARDFVSHNGKTYKAIKNPKVGVSPSDNKEREWLDMSTVGGKEKVEKKSIGGIFADLVAKAKKDSDKTKEILYSKLERRNQDKQSSFTSTDKEKVQSDKYVVISRHPYDIMGASADRGWGSCQNVGVGQEDYSTTLKRGEVKEWVSGNEYKSGATVIHGDKIYTSTSATKEEPGKSGEWRIDDRWKVATKKNNNTGKLTKVAVRNFVMNKIDIRNILKGHEKATDEEAYKNMCQLGQTGSYYHGIGADVRYGAMVAYLINADDTNINNPITRMLIKPYVKMEGPKAGEVYLFASSSLYGGGTGSRAKEDKTFRTTVENWLDEHQSGEGAYHIKQGGTSASEPFETAKWERHYHEEPEKMTAKDYRGNVSNVKEFKDGLEWDEVIEQHRWFARNEFKKVVIGEDAGTLIVYDGEITGGTWDDGAEMLGGTISGVFINKGKFENVTVKNCEVVNATFKNCNMEDIKWKIRGEVSNCDIDKIVVSGSIKGTNGTKVKNMSFSNVHEGSVINFTKCTIGDSKDLQGVYDGCEFSGNNVTFSKEAVIKNATLVDFNLNGGTFESGTLKSGTFKNVKINKIIMTGGTLISCDIKHGIIKNGILKNCIFHDGVFGHSMEVGRKRTGEEEGEFKGKSFRNPSKFFGGEFRGGTFAGGMFIDGKWFDKAKWTGGFWMGGENKPANAKTKEDEKKKEERNLDIKKMFRGSKYLAKKEEE